MPVMTLPRKAPRSLSDGKRDLRTEHKRMMASMALDDRGGSVVL